MRWLPYKCSGRGYPAHKNGKNMDTNKTDASLNRLKITIDGRTAFVAPGTTVLESARQLGISIPTLCSYRGLSPYGACRICIVEIDTPRGPKQAASCTYPVENNMVVHTDTPQIRESRSIILELLLAQAPDSTELAVFAAKYGVSSTSFTKAKTGSCILCGLCVRACGDLMGRSAISLFGRGAKREVRTGVRRKKRSMPGVRRMRFRLSHGRNRTCANCLTSDQETRYGL